MVVRDEAAFRPGCNMVAAICQEVGLGLKMRMGRAEYRENVAGLYNGHPWEAS